MKRPEFYIPENAGRAELEQRLASDDPQAVFNALLDAAYYEDCAWVQGRCITALSSPVALVRTGALCALKILACVRGELDAAAIVPAIAALKDDPDPEIVALAEGTLADIRHAFGH